MNRIARLTDLAGRMNLSPAYAVALPTVVTVAARRVGMSDDAMISEALLNAPLRSYLADVCRTATKAL